jgi:hypothetical protein
MKINDIDLFKLLDFALDRQTINASAFCIQSVSRPQNQTTLTATI